VRPPYGTSMTYQHSNSLNERFIIVLARLSTNLLYTLLILTAFSYGVNGNKLSPYRHLQQVQYHRPLSSLSTQTGTTHNIRELNLITYVASRTGLHGDFPEIYLSKFLVDSTYQLILNSLVCENLPSFLITCLEI